MKAILKIAGSYAILGLIISIVKHLYQQIAQGVPFGENFIVETILICSTFALMGIMHEIRKAKGK